MEEPGRLQSMRSQRVGQDWATSLSLFSKLWRPLTCSITINSQAVSLLSFLSTFSWLSQSGWPLQNKNVSLSPLYAKPPKGFSWRMQTKDLTLVHRLCPLIPRDASSRSLPPTQPQWHRCPCCCFNAPRKLTPNSRGHLFNPYQEWSSLPHISHALTSLKSLFQCHLLREAFMEHLLEHCSYLWLLGWRGVEGAKG